jgi:hypothetical protein
MCRRFWENLLDVGIDVDVGDIRDSASRHRHRFTPPGTPEDYWDLNDMTGDRPPHPYNPMDEGVKEWARGGLGRRNRGGADRHRGGDAGDGAGAADG